MIDGSLVAGDVIVADGVIVEVGVAGSRPLGAIAVPGFVDVQINGFGGIDFSNTDLAGCRSASRDIARAGTTAVLATMPTTRADRYIPALAVLRDACTTRLPGARFLGVHLEGPFLSPARAGAHNPAWLRLPDDEVAASWLSTAPIAMMTLAPELPGALALTRLLRTRGVLVALGHTDATKHAAHAGFDAGATMVTHLWNAQRQPTSREPAVCGVGLVRRDVHVGVICDLVHVDADTVLLSHSAAGERFVAVTDAVWLAGLPDGTYSMGGRPLTKAAGAIRLADGTLVGGAGTLDEALRHLVGLGVPLLAALATITSAPRAVLGAHAAGCGRICVGDRADVVVLDEELRVRTVLVGGEALG